MTKRIRNVMIAVLALVAGGLIYILLRENTYIAQLFHHNKMISFLRQTIPMDKWMWISFYLPDYLWGFALTCALIALFMPSRKGAVLCGVAAALCGLAWELLQVSQLVRGTGDWWDVMMYFVASTTGILINLKERKV